MNAPKVTLEDVENSIKSDTYIVLPDERTTVCMLTLDNGYTVRGESSCVSRENFDTALGQKYAREDAVRKVWPLLGFRLADKLAAAARGPRGPRGPRFRDAGTGEYVTAEYAATNPDTTVRES